MRVLHVAAGNMYGGVETVLATLARNAPSAPTLEQHFAVSFRGRLSQELEEAGAPVHPLGEVRVRSPLSVARARSTLRTVMRRERIEVVICHFPWAMTVFGRALRATGGPLVFWLHDRADGGHWLQRLAKRTRPDLVICNSQYTARTLPALYPGVPARVVYYPVQAGTSAEDADARERTRAEFGVVGETVILQVSRLERWKGHELHLRSLALLRDLPGWTCWMVGGAQRQPEANYFVELKELAKRLGIGERVRFLGQRSDVPRLMAAADIHCQPNTGPEPFGIVFVEALYAGVPCVTTRMGGAMEIVDASCGKLVPPEEGAVAEALRGLVEDGETRRRLGAAGPARASALCAPAARIGDLMATLEERFRSERA